MVDNLKCDSKYITGGEEFMASPRPTFWRALIFSRHPAHVRKQGEFCAEDYVGLYHKDAESYLCYDPAVSDKPMFMISTRVSFDARKKTSWLWKIEKDTLVSAGDPIVCKSSSFYRIKHVATKKYLAKTEDGGLKLIQGYNTPLSLWSFKSLTKAMSVADRASGTIHEEGGEVVKSNTLVYVRGFNGGWLTHKVRVQHKGQGADQARLADAGLMNFDQPSERDAIRFLPVRPGDIRAVTEMRERAEVPYILNPKP